MQNLKHSSLKSSGNAARYIIKNKWWFRAITFQSKMPILLNFICANFCNFHIFFNIQRCEWAKFCLNITVMPYSKYSKESKACVLVWTPAWWLAGVFRPDPPWMRWGPTASWLQHHPWPEALAFWGRSRCVMQGNVRWKIFTIWCWTSKLTSGQDSCAGLCAHL